MGEARRDLFTQCNAGVDVVQAHIWRVAALGEARCDYFLQCNAGADVVHARIWRSVWWHFAWQAWGHVPV